MRLFQTNIYQRIIDVITTLVIVVSFLGCMIIPQVVNAETQEVATILPIPEDLFTETAQFPTSEERQAANTIWVVVTAYSSTPDQTDSTPCITANGHNLCTQHEEQGEGNTIAANFLRFGKQVRLPEFFQDKVFVVRDRMNERYGYGRIDVWMPTREEAKQFGVRILEMELY